MLRKRKEDPARHKAAQETHFPRTNQPLDRNQNKTIGSRDSETKERNPKAQNDPTHPKQCLETLPTPCASLAADTWEVGYTGNEAHF